MGKAPYCEQMSLKKGSWTPEEDKILVEHIHRNGHGSWRSVPKQAGLLRCGKSCRLRWTNYLRPDVKRGRFSPQEERTIIQLHAILGNRWSAIASQLPGRTDNEIKNFCRSTHLKKKLLRMGLDPSTNATKSDTNTATGSKGSQSSALTRHTSQWENARLEAEARLSKESTLSSSSSRWLGNDNADASAKEPTDYFLKIWNSEAGKVFKEAINSNTKNIRINGENLHGVDLDQEHAFPRTDTRLQLNLAPLSSLCSGCSSDPINIDQPDRVNHN